MLPFFVSEVRRANSNVTPKMAGIVLNLFGLVMGFLHLLLRSNADVTAIRPLTATWAQTRRWRFFGSSDLDMGAQMKTPVAMERSLSTHRMTRSQNEKYRQLFSPDIQQPTSDIRSVRSANSVPEPPVPPKSALQAGLARKKSINYSVFPANNPHAKKPSANALCEGEDDVVLLPPQPLFIRRHQRESSNISSATVQIGLRLSHGILPPGTEMVDASAVHLPIQSPNSPHSSSSRRPWRLSQQSTRDSSAQSMDLPIQFKPPTPSPQHSPMQEQHPIKSPQTPASPWPMISASLKNRRNGAQIIQEPGGDYRMKSLPPIPGRPISEVMTVSDRGSEHLSTPRRSISNPSPGSRRSSGRERV